MSAGAIGYSDVVGRIGAIQSQLAALSGAFTPASASASATGGATGAGTGASAGAGASSLGGAAAGLGTGGAGATSSFSTALSGAMAGGAAPATGASALPSRASTMLTSGQQQFASRLAAQTGLDPGVVSAWLLAEESGGAAVSRQSAGNNDWLNIGYTDSGTYGAGASIWRDPVSAADATAGWLKGQDTIPGYGRASSGVQAILQTAGQPAAAQISALQGSGWASSGYPSLGSLYSQVAG